MSPIGVAFGGPSPEHDISILTGLQAARVLDAAGHDVVGLYWSKTEQWHVVAATHEAEDFVDGPPRDAKPAWLVAVEGQGFVEDARRHRSLGIDVVVNCCHGEPGEGGQLQAALELAHVDYTGPSSAGAALGMDKLATSAVAARVGVPVIEQSLLGEGLPPPGGDGPFIVKPRWGGSSIGIEVVADVATALALRDSSPHLRRGAVIEPYLDGWHDLQLSVRTYPEFESSPIERPLRGDTEIFDYRQKYLSGEQAGLEHAARELPAQLPPSVTKGITGAVAELAEALSIRGVPRIDFLWDGHDRFVFNEINTIPGALALYLWEAAGITKAQVLETLIEEARRTRPAAWSSLGADGTALRSARTIASKLA
jgi:D-alanine-D-alanine ligase